MGESLRLWWVEMTPYALPLAVAGVGLLVALALGWLLLRN
jgi:hypothetical protein